MRDLPTVVFDTNVIEAALRSRRGASFALLSMAGTGRFEIAVSVPLVCEYQDVLMRQVARGAREESTVTDVVDYLCSIAKRQSIFFLWRPWLTDPKDDMILELAVAANCDAIVTHNRRHLRAARDFGIRVLSPAEFYAELKGES